MGRAFLVLSLLAASSLMAQGVRINGGVQVGLAVPVGDFATKETSSGDPLGANNGAGFHLGGHMDFNFNPHHQLRLHMTAHAFASMEKDTDYSDDYSGDDDWDDDDFDFHDYGDNADSNHNGFGIFQIGGDYVFNFKSPSKGPYVLAGIHLNSVRKTAHRDGIDDYNASQSGRMGLRVGGGYTFNRVLSVEGQVNSISVDAKGADGFGIDSLVWVSVSAVFRFGRP